MTTVVTFPYPCALDCRIHCLRLKYSSIAMTITTLASQNPGYPHGEVTSGSLKFMP